MSKLCACGKVGDWCKCCSRYICKDCHSEVVTDKIFNASPDQLNSATIKMRKRGGKFSVLADMLSGNISLDEFDKRMEQLKRE